MTYTRYVVCSAVYLPLHGVTLIGARHWDFQMQRQYARLFPDSDPEPCQNDEQGFIDQRGDFMTRTQAWHVAEQAGQIRRRCGGDVTNGGTLYSENLY